MLPTLTRQQPPSIAVRGIAPPLQPLAGLAARIACLFSASFETAAERLEGACDTLQGVRCGVRWQRRCFVAAQVRQVVALLGIASADTLALPGGTSLLQRRIGQQAMRLTRRLQRGCWRWRGIEAIGGTTVDSFQAINEKLVMETKQPLKTLHHCGYNLNFH